MLFKDAKDLFILDGLGAFLSLCMHLLILAYFQEAIGLPINALLVFSIFPIIYLLFDWFAYKANPSFDQRNLLIIALSNLMYCVIVAVVLITYKDLISVLGGSYFLIEIILILVIASMEYRTSNTLKRQPTS